MTGTIAATSTAATIHTTPILIFLFTLDLSFVFCSFIAMTLWSRNTSLLYSPSLHVITATFIPNNFIFLLPVIIPEDKF